MGIEGIDILRGDFEHARPLEALLRQVTKQRDEAIEKALRTALHLGMGVRITEHEVDTDFDSNTAIFKTEIEITDEVPVGEIHHRKAF